MTKTKRLLSRACGVVVLIAAALGAKDLVQAQDATPQMLDPSLRVRTVVSGLTVPIGLAFLASNDLLVFEKDTGEVKRVVNGIVTSTVLDLGVNFNSERGLLGIALHPDFPSDPGVYLFWTCRSTALPADPFFPDERAASTRTCSRPTAARYSGAAARQSRRSVRLGWTRRCTSTAI